MFKLVCIIVALLLKHITKSNEFLIWGIVLVIQDMILQSNDDIYTGMNNVFPEEMYKNPRHLRFLFRHAYFDTEHVPKLAIIHIYLLFVLTILLNGLFLLIIITIPPEYKIELMTLSASLALTLDILMAFFFIGWTTKVCFLNKFKRITKVNIKYLFARLLFVDAAEKEPSAVLCGKCSIISRKLIKRREVVTIRLIEIGEVVETVLLGSNKEYKGGEVYKLYEICGVKYID